MLENCEEFCLQKLINENKKSSPTLTSSPPSLIKCEMRYAKCEEKEEEEEVKRNSFDSF